MWIEQAVYSRAAGGHTNHYELTAQSPGISPSDASALAIWGPAHDCLLDTHARASSVNFFPLPSGSYCISRSVAYTRGMSQDGARGLSHEGSEVLTHALVIPAAALAEVHNDPFAIIEVMNAAARWLVAPPRDAELPAFELQVAAPLVDETRIGRAVSIFGLSWLVGAVDVLLHHAAVAVIGDSTREQLVSAVMTCLPPSCRVELSFSTGLKYSPRRPFRLFAVGLDPVEQRRVNRQGDVVMLDLRDEAPQPENTVAGWSGWLNETLVHGDLPAISARFSDLPRGVHLARLDAWGDLLLDRAEDERPAALDDVGSPTWNESTATSARVTRHDGPRLAPTAETTAVVDLAADPAIVLGRDCPGAVEMLETLDDAVFETIVGKPGALEELRTLWPEVLRRVGPELVEEARALYVRHVMNLWRHCIDGDEVRNPTLSVTATELIDFMLGGR